MVTDLTGVAISALAVIIPVVAKIAVDEIRAHIKNRTMRDLLESAVNNAMGKIQQAGEQEIAQAQLLRPDISNPLVAVGVRYVVNHAPEAMEHYGITVDAIADKIEARIGLANIAHNLAVTASPSPSNPAPLENVPIYPAGSVTTADLNRTERERVGA